MLIPSTEVNILNTFRVMIILRLLLLLTNLNLKLLSTQGTGADKLLSTQRVTPYSAAPGSPRRTRRRLPGTPGSKKNFFFSKCLMERILICL